MEHLHEGEHFEDAGTDFSALVDNLFNGSGDAWGGAANQASLGTHPVPHQMLEALSQSQSMQQFRGATPTAVGTLEGYVADAELFQNHHSHPETLQQLGRPLHESQLMAGAVQPHGVAEKSSISNVSHGAAGVRTASSALDASPSLSGPPGLVSSVRAAPRIPHPASRSEFFASGAHAIGTDARSRGVHTNLGPASPSASTRESDDHRTTSSEDDASRPTAAVLSSAAAAERTLDLPTKAHISQNLEDAISSMRHPPQTSQTSLASSASSGHSLGSASGPRSEGLRAAARRPRKVIGKQAPQRSAPSNVGSPGVPALPVRNSHGGGASSNVNAAGFPVHEEPASARRSGKAQQSEPGPSPGPRSAQPDETPTEPGDSPSLPTESPSSRAPPATSAALLRASSVVPGTYMGRPPPSRSGVNSSPGGQRAGATVDVARRTEDEMMNAESSSCPPQSSSSFVEDTTSGSQMNGTTAGSVGESPVVRSAPPIDSSTNADTTPLAAGAIAGASCAPAGGSSSSVGAREGMAQASSETSAPSVRGPGAANARAVASATASNVPVTPIDMPPSHMGRGPVGGVAKPASRVSGHGRGGSTAKRLSPANTGRARASRPEIRASWSSSMLSDMGGGAVQAHGNPAVSPVIQSESRVADSSSMLAGDATRARGNGAIPASPLQSHVQSQERSTLSGSPSGSRSGSGTYSAKGAVPADRARGGQQSVRTEAQSNGDAAPAARAKANVSTMPHVGASTESLPHLQLMSLHNAAGELAGATPSRANGAGNAAEGSDPSKGCAVDGNDMDMMDGLEASPSQPNLSHTKMCRDRLNNMFDRLRDTLPAPPVGIDIKHKAQVLDYACIVLRDMVQRTANLEAELALSSMRATSEWALRTVNESSTFRGAVSKVMSLFCLRREWALAELWTAATPPRVSITGRLDASTKLKMDSCLFRDQTTAVMDPNLNEFVKNSRTQTVRLDSDIMGHAWTSMHHQWVTELSECPAFGRSSQAAVAGLKTCFAVPVTVGGRVEAVVAFFDTKHRPEDPACIEVAMRLTWALGNAIGGKRAAMTRGAALSSTSNGLPPDL